MKAKGLSLKDVAKLQKEPGLRFHNGALTNLKAARIFVKQMRQGGYKIFHQAIIETMIKQEASRNNVFGVMYLTQFCVHWDNMFPNTKEIHMGQVDMIMRKHYA